MLLAKKTEVKKPEAPKIEVRVSDKTSIKVPRANTENIMCVFILLLVIPGAIIYRNSDWIPAARYSS